MKRKPAISPGGSLVLPALAGHVALHDVVFHYPARPDVRVLCGLSLEAQPGQVVALVGPSGGGKVGSCPVEKGRWWHWSDRAGAARLVASCLQMGVPLSPSVHTVPQLPMSVCASCTPHHSSSRSPASSRCWSAYTFNVLEKPIIWRNL